MGRGASAAVLVIIALAGVCLGAGPKHDAAKLAKKARKSEKRGDNAQAYILYSEAAALEPKNNRYKRKMSSLQTTAAMQARPAPLPENDPVTRDLEPTLAPDQVFDSMTAQEFARARQPQEPPALRAKSGVQDFDLTGDARQLFDQAAQRFGLETVYDADYPQSGARIRFQITGADYREALHSLEAATDSFVVPLSSRLFMIAKDTPQKRNDLEQTMAITIPVPQALTAQELTEIAQAIRQVTDIQKLAWNSAQNQIVIRDRISRVLPARELLYELFAYRPEIVMELEFLEVSNSDLYNYGFTVTNSFPLIYLGDILNYKAVIPANVMHLVTFGGGKTLFGLGVAEAQALFNATFSSMRTLLKTQLRSADGQAATFHVGEKYPVLTAGYFGTVPPNQQGQVHSPPPSYTFEDLGVSVKITPRVHGMGEMSLNVEAGFEVLTGSAVNGIPIIGNRRLATQVRLRNDEWAIIAGLINKANSKSTSAFWGLSSIPLLGRLFQAHTKQTDNQNVLIAIKPHLIAIPPDQIVTHRLRVGSDTRPFTPL